MRPYLIGIAGPAGAGKSTLASAVIKELVLTGYRAVRESFAQPIKAATAAAGLTDPLMHGDPTYKATTLPCGRTPRFLWQTLGTEWGRRLVRESVWTDLLIERCHAPDYFYVIDDVRFPNEALAIHESGGVLLFLDRQTRRLKHESEAYLDRLRQVADHEFHNNDTPQRLISLAEWLVSEGLNIQ